MNLSGILGKRNPALLRNLCCSEWEGPGIANLPIPDRQRIPPISGEPIDGFRLRPQRRRKKENGHEQPDG